jgi:hypothetical protein
MREKIRDSQTECGYQGYDQMQKFIALYPHIDILTRIDFIANHY